METTYHPEIPDTKFRTLPAPLLEGVLERSIEYGFYEHLQEFRDEFRLCSEDINYHEKMEEIMNFLLEDTWYMISNEAADNDIPVFIFQKENASLFLSGAIAEKLHGVVMILTAGTKSELRFFTKKVNGLMTT
ncbi:hypothetical protein GF325_19255 [Candidatus Bathyarchaeota archaeon]|nr:hypothetical protein [Candidatus Bathyarchaeota archaeon]